MDITIILENVLYDILDMDVYIYPASITGTEEDDYTVRTPYMEGWNDAVIHQAEELIRILEKHRVKIYDDRIEILFDEE